MINIIKRLFSKTKKKDHASTPGRTFNKVLTGRYFGCEDVTADASKVALAKQYKIDQISKLALNPAYLKYTYTISKEQDSEVKIVSAHVTFQKEVFVKKRNMVHTTEIAFTVNRDDLDEFEQMSGTSLGEDFKDLTQNTKTSDPKREKRSKELTQELTQEITKKISKKRRKRRTT